MKKVFSHHELLYKFKSRIITTKLLISICNAEFYTPYIPGVNLCSPDQRRYETLKIKDRIFLKTLDRETTHKIKTQ